MIDKSGKLDEKSEKSVRNGLNILQLAISFNNFQKGWREETPMGETKRPVAEHISLIHSEVTEAFEAYRNNEPELWYEHTDSVGKKSKPTDKVSGEPALYPGDRSGAEVLGKPQGIASELADAIIRVLDFSDEHELDVAEAVVRKHNYNLTREYRHGGKRV